MHSNELVGSVGIYRAMLLNMPIGAAIWQLGADNNLILVDANRAAEVTSGATVQMRVGAKMRQLFPDVSPQREEIYREAALTSESRDLGRVSHTGWDGAERTTLVKIVGLPERCIGILFEDITDQMRAEDEVRRSEARLRALLENSGDGVSITDASGKIVFMSASVFRMLGLHAHELEGTAAFDLVHPEDAELARANFGHILAHPGTPFTNQLRWKHRDGGYRDLEIVTVNHLDDPNLRGVVSNFRDVSERRHATEKLRQAQERSAQSQRLEAIGKLAAGVAHDFNNLLSIILSLSALMEAKMTADDPSRMDVAEIYQAGKRAADLTRQLLAFSRQQILDPKVLDLNEIVFNMDRMLQRIVGEDIRIRTVRGNHLRRVRLDPGQIEQVIMNLVVNARDAMPEGGALTIETGNVELDESYARAHVGVTLGITSCWRSATAVRAWRKKFKHTSSNHSLQRNP